MRYNQSLLWHRQGYNIKFVQLSYYILFKPGREQANADVLSRLPLEETIENVPLLGNTVQMLETLNTGDSIVATAAIKAWTDRDAVLSSVRTMVMKGWHSHSDKEAFKPHKQRESELSVEGGCVL